MAAADDGEGSEDEGWGMLCSLVDESDLVPSDYRPVHLTAALPHGARSFTVQQDGAARARPVAGLGESEAAVATGAVVWDGSVVLAAALPHLATTLNLCTGEAGGFNGVNVLEVGAGSSGLPGLVAAALGASVTLTDGASVLLPSLRAAVEANCSDAERARVNVAELRWGDLSAATASAADTVRPRSYDLVLAAECIYDVDAVSPLLALLTTALSPGGKSRALVSVDKKIGRDTAYAAFEELAAASFDVEQSSSETRRSIRKRLPFTFSP